MAGDEADAIVIATCMSMSTVGCSAVASLLNPSFYFPAQASLAYRCISPEQIFYAPLRALGVEQLLAVQIMWGWP